MSGLTIYVHEPLGTRHLLIARLADQYILQGAFDFPVTENTVIYVNEFCRRIITICALPTRKLGQAEKLVNYPYYYSMPNSEPGSFLDRNFLEKMTVDIESELQMHEGKEDQYEILSKAEVLGWRIALLTAIYSHCEYSLPNDAYRQACEAILAVIPLSDDQAPSNSILSLLSGTDNRINSQERAA